MTNKGNDTTLDNELFIALEENNHTLMKNMYLIINSPNKSNYIEKDMFAAIDLFKDSKHTLKYIVYLDILKTTLINPDKFLYIDYVTSNKWKSMLIEFLPLINLWENLDGKEDINFDVIINNLKEKTNKKEIIRLFTKYKENLCSINSYFLKRHAELIKFDNIGFSYSNIKKDKGKL